MQAFSRNVVSGVKLASQLTHLRSLSIPTSDKKKFKVLVVGGGTFNIVFPDHVSLLDTLTLAGSGGLSVAHQIYNRFKAAGKPLNRGDVAIVDGAEYHYYQVCIFAVRTRLCDCSSLKPGVSLGGKYHTMLLEFSLMIFVGLWWAQDYDQRRNSVVHSRPSYQNTLHTFQKTSKHFRPDHPRS